MDIQIDTHEVEANLKALDVKMLAALDMYGDTVSKGLEAKAKRDRPWTDRTSRARQGLTGSSDLGSEGLTIVLAHTVDYGVWLELAHEKNWAIVEPTMRLEQNGIVQGLENLFSKVKL